jgi:hypothetical protein
MRQSKVKILRRIFEGKYGLNKNDRQKLDYKSHWRKFKKLNRHEINEVENAKM